MLHYEATVEGLIKEDGQHASIQVNISYPEWDTSKDSLEIQREIDSILNRIQSELLSRWPIQRKY